MRTRLIFILLLFSACTDLSHEVKQSLQLAGDNRSELKKVLNHYHRRAADSLKFKAACFLIDHMKWHVSDEQTEWVDPRFAEIHQQIDNRFQAIAEGLSLKDLTSAEVRKVFGKKEKITKSLFDSTLRETQIYPDVCPDLAYIKGDFLIDHIENAFRLRDSLTEINRLSFEDFCNYILPYRSCEYAWFSNGKELNRIFSPYLNHPEAKNTNERLKWYNTYTYRMKCLYARCPIKNTTGIYDLFFNGKHDCTGIASHAVNVFRACGLPTAIDFNAAYRDFTSRHFHCSVMDTCGVWRSFNPESEVPGDYNFSKYSGINIFRFMYAAQEDSPRMLKNEQESVPRLFSSPCIREVTSCTKEVKEVTLPCRIPETNRLAYLYAFQRNEQGLTPATWGVIDHQANSVSFPNVLFDILYFPVYLDDHQEEYFAPPFWISRSSDSKTGFRMHTLEETDRDTSVCGEVILMRKFPRKTNMVKICQDMPGGTFWGANQKDFKDAHLLYTITQPLIPYLQEFPVRRPRAYQYYRYVAPDQHPQSNISMLELIAPATKEYTNTAPATPLPILKPGQEVSGQAVKLLTSDPEKMNKQPWFDGKMTTSSGGRKMITVELEQPQVVTAFRVAPLSADNGIYPGDRYELMYWDKGWQSCGEQKAVCHYVGFKNVPPGKLYWLKNLNRGKEELPFLLRGGQQLFIYYDWLK